MHRSYLLNRATITNFKYSKKEKKRIMKNQLCPIFLSFVWIFFTGNIAEASNLNVEEPKTSFEVYQPQSKTGKEIFQANCSVCHIGGTNIIIPEKNLKKNSLEANGMNSLNAISYQIINGKNGMPAFGGRLQEEEIEILASYVLKQSLTDFADN